MTDTPHQLTLDQPTQTAIDDLPAASRDRLNRLIADADRTQRDQIAHAIDGAMAVIPAPFRKRVRKMVMG